MKPTLWKIGTASFEASVWEGEYRGTWIRLERQTDENYWPGHNPSHEKDPTVTNWWGFVAGDMEGLKPRWDLVAECHATRREALAVLVRYINQRLAGGSER